MEFSQPKGIYQQIADQICDRIVDGGWGSGDRIPSIREFAVELGVNPNTVTRSYQSLLDQEIIENRRGIGYFVASKARETILRNRRAEFIRDELPRLLKTLEQLRIGVDDLHALAVEVEPNTRRRS